MVTAGRIRLVCLALKTARVLLLLAIPVLAVLVWMRMPQAPVLADTQADTSHVDTSQGPVAHELAWYAPLWQRDLKQPPIPRKAAKPTERPRESGPLPRLLATLVEPHARYAHLVDRSGKMQLKGIDEVIHQYRVRAIEPGRVQLQDGERLVWVEIQKRKGQR